MRGAMKDKDKSMFDLPLNKYLVERIRKHRLSIRLLYSDTEVMMFLKTIWIRQYYDYQIEKGKVE